MFSKKSNSDSQNNEKAERAALRSLLQEAVDRNATIGIVRLGHAGQDPLAQGRLIELDDESIVVEQLQIIGKDIRFPQDTRVEAYIKLKNDTMVFESTIKRTELASKINDRTIVKSLRLSPPRLLRKGDRRSAYRSSVTGVSDDIPVRMWFIDRIETTPQSDPQPRQHTQVYYTDLIAARRGEPVTPRDEDGNEAKSFEWPPVIERIQDEKPHAMARLVDLTANGIGILMYGIAQMQLNRFERAVLQMELEDELVNLVVEIRQGVDLRGSTCRVGTLVIHPDIGSIHAPQRRILEQVAMRVQREHLKHRKSA